MQGMSRLPQLLMINYESRKLRSGFYDPKRSSAKTNTIVSVVACVLFGVAAWYSLTSSLYQQQTHHYEQGWQRACEKLKQ